MVVDRLFLWIFSLACFFGTVIILLQAPTFYDNRTPIGSWKWQKKFPNLCLFVNKKNEWMLWIKKIKKFLIGKKKLFAFIHLLLIYRVERRAIWQRWKRPKLWWKWSKKDDRRPSRRISNRWSSPFVRRRLPDVLSKILILLEFLAAGVPIGSAMPHWLSFGIDSDANFLCDPFSVEEERNVPSILDRGPHLAAKVLKTSANEILFD